MGTVSKTIKEIPLDVLAGIDKMFGNEMKIDVENVPKKYRPMFDKTRSASFAELKMKGIYESYKIDHILKDQIWLRSGEVLESKMYANMFCRSSELVFYVVSVNGYKALEDAENNMLGKIFLDSWGTSIVESGCKWLWKSVAKDLESCGIYSTASFSPGQHNVPMEIQKVIFGKLKPSEIGITLNDHYLMNPKKSISGVFGIGKEKSDNSLRPCNFCELRKTCPNAYSGDYM